MHARSAKLICDKCGFEVEIDPSIERPFSSTFVVSEQNYRGWGEVNGKHFCPDCFGAYKDMCRKKDEEIAEIFGI